MSKYTVFIKYGIFDIEVFNNELDKGRVSNPWIEF